MERAYFRIDFLKPGKNLAPVKAWVIVLEKLDGFYQLFVKRLYRKVSTSVTLLTITFVFVLLGGIFFYTQVYLPREDTLKSKSQEIVQLQAQVKIMRQKVEQQQERQQAREGRIAQLRELQEVDIKWKNKLAGLRRSIVDNLWLTAMTVKDKSKPVRIVLRGSSFSDDVENKPLRIIADFINNLVAAPSWRTAFALKDWHVSSSPDGEAEVVSFEMSLEGK